MKSLSFCICLVAILFQLGFSSDAGAITLSGTVTNNSGITGRIYVSLITGSGISWYGTSVDASQGNGTYPFSITTRESAFSGAVGAMLDPATRGDGVITGSSLTAASDTLILTGDQSGIALTLASQQAQSPAQVDAGSVALMPMDGAVTINWRNPRNQDGLDINDSYNIYWSTSSTVSTTSYDGRILGIPSTIGQDVHQVVTSVSNGQGYYFLVESVLGSAKSTPTLVGPVTPGTTSPTGHQLSGTVNFTGVTPGAGQSLYIVVENVANGATYIGRVAAPAASQTFTVPGVDPGSYRVFAFLDRNANNRFDGGDISSLQGGTVFSMPAADFAIPRALTIRMQNTEAFMGSYRSTGPMSQQAVSFNFQARAKTPAHVVVNGGPGVGTFTLGMWNWQQYEYWVLVPSFTDADTCSVTITYGDGSSETLPLRLSGPQQVPSAISPSGTSGPDALHPTLAWTTSTPPTGDYHFEVSLGGNGISWSAVTDRLHHSVVYDGPGLTPGLSYNWSVTTVDLYGNRGESTQTFTPSATGPQITGMNLSTGTAGTSVSVTGSNLSAGTAPQVSFGGVTSAPSTYSSGSLQVPVPVGAPSGPVTVTVSGVTATSASPFIPTVTYTTPLQNQSKATVSGATLSTFEYPSLSSSTDASGNYVLSGVPSGLPFTLSINASGYLPVYSSELMNQQSSTNPLSFTAYTQAQVNTWNGGATGLGLLRSKVVDGSLTGLSGITVNAFSSLYGTFGHYAVAYNDASGNYCTACTSTGPDGHYYVLNVEEGDTVTVFGTGNGYTFNNRTFRTHAGSVGEGRLVGTLAPAVISFNPLQASAGTQVTISGSFPDQNASHYIVRIGGVPQTVNQVTATSLTFTVGSVTWTVPTQVIVTYNGTDYPLGSVTPLFTLTGNIVGSGSINSTAGASFACAQSSCDSTYGSNTSLTLHAAPSAGYQFSGWSGACTGTSDCMLDLLTDETVTATFSPLQYVRIGSTYYSTLSTALAAAVDGSTVEAQALVFTEPDLVFNESGASVIIKGGLTSAFGPGSSTDYTTIDGKLSVRGGTLRPDRVNIR